MAMVLRRARGSRVVRLTHRLQARTRGCFGGAGLRCCPLPLRRGGTGCGTSSTMEFSQARGPLRRSPTILLL
eukprot:scaffold281221_cov31-Tisochrysis_lutea.AAC.1